MISNRVLRSSKSDSNHGELTENEWMIMHDVLLKRSSGAVPSSVGLEKNVWQSRKVRTKRRLKEYTSGKLKVDWVVCELLKKEFTKHQLKRFGIFHLIPISSSASSGSSSAGTSSAPSLGGAQGCLDGSLARLIMDQASTSGVVSSPNESQDQQLSSVPAPFLDSWDQGPSDTPSVGAAATVAENRFYDVAAEAEKLKRKRPLQSVLASWAVEFDVSDAAKTALLHRIHRVDPVLDLTTLPRSGRTLTKVPKDAGIPDNYNVTDISETVPLPEGAYVKRRRLARNEKARLAAAASGEEPEIPLEDQDFVHEKVEVRHYMHFGVEETCNMKSPGVVCRKELVRVLKMAVSVAPQILSMEVLRIIDPGKYMKAQADPVFRESLGMCKETVFWIDMNIDGVQLFKAGKVSQGIPILCRIYGFGSDPKETKPTVVVPTDMGYVSMIGMYHGVNKPSLEKFVGPMLEELRELNPQYPIDETDPNKRTLSVRVRSMICDAKERPWLKGTGKHNSFHGCERCFCRGVKLRGCTRFMCINARKRKNEDWDQYGHPDHEGKRHRIKDTPFSEHPRPVDMVFGFPIEDMHEIGGGAAMTGLGHIFGTKEDETQAKKDENKKKKKKRKRAQTQEAKDDDQVPDAIKNLVDAYTRAWKKPKEIGRDVLSIRKVGSSKMRVAHNYVTYFVIPLFSVEEIRTSLQAVPAYKEICDVPDLFMCFVISLHLICMTRHDSPSKEDITFAKECLNSYVRGMFLVFGFAFMNYKNHCLLHLADEARYFMSHTGGFNAYSFENFLGLLRRLYVKSGKNVLKQVYNKLRQKAYHGSCSNDPLDGLLGEVDLEDDVLVDLVKKHGSMDFPQWTVLDSNTGKGRKYVTCRGFEVTLKYPDNVVVLANESNVDNNNLDVIVVVVTNILRDGGGKLHIEGRRFRNLVGAHSEWKRNYHPLNLKKLGCYQANEGLEDDFETWSFERVRGKCFPFHLNLNATYNPAGYRHQAARFERRKQKWVLIRLKHTCRPNTLTATDVPPGDGRKHFPSEGRDCDCEGKWTNKTRVASQLDLDEDYFNLRSSL